MIIATLNIKLMLRVYMIILGTSGSSGGDSILRGAEVDEDEELLVAPLLPPSDNQGGGG
jgi:hypothetical protein